MSRRTCRGFTLIEVLVVVSLIALLIAVLVPSLANARDQAQTVVCKTRLRELYYGHLFYAHEQKQFFPHYEWWLWDAHPIPSYNYPEAMMYYFPDLYAKTGGKYPSDSSRWVEFGQIHRYMKDKEMYFCPKDRKRRIGVAIGAGGAYGSKPIHSYSRVLETHYFSLWHVKGNRNVSPQEGVLDATDFLSIERITPKNLGVEASTYLSEFYGKPTRCRTTPDRVALLFEEWPNGEGDSLISTDRSAASSSLVSMDNGTSFPALGDFFAMRHRQKSNVLYWDGHTAMADARCNNHTKDRMAAYVIMGAGR
ncbi:MAG: prepilin-type N-terminal cleavage/methylation domain-containing protein [Phycisphaerae bacterium]|nr:prepilin-type N-terminal cleavage/methylation domain-containing protein [Phycisphaerae bacterium]